MQDLCLRVLTEAYEGWYAESPLYKYFEQFGEDSWAQHEFNGASEAVTGIIMNVKYHDIRQKYFDTEYYVYDQAIYDVYISSKWIPSLTKEIFYSRA